MKKQIKFIYALLVIVIVGGGVVVGLQGMVYKSEINQIEISQIFSDRIIESVSTRDGEITVIIRESQPEDGNTYLILIENGKEKIIDSGFVNIKVYGYTEGNRVITGPLVFSPKNNYLAYGVNDGWEFWERRIYDIKNSQIISNILQDPKFTPDEKYLCDSDASPVTGDFYGKVYSIPDFKEIYNLPIKEDNDISMIRCEYKKDNIIQFKVYENAGYYDTDEELEKEVKITEFSTITGKIQ